MKFGDNAEKQVFFLEIAISWFSAFFPNRKNPALNLTKNTDGGKSKSDLKHVTKNTRNP